MPDIIKKNIISWLMSALAVVLVIAAGFLNAYLAWYLLLASLIFLIVVFIIFKNPFWGILIISFTLPLERIGAYETGFTTIRLSQVVLAATLVAWLANMLVRRSFSFARNPVLIPLIIFLTLGLLALPNSLNLDRSLTVFIYIIFTSLLAFIVPNLVTTKEQLNKVIIFVLISFLLVSIFGLWQFVGDMSGLDTSVTGLRELYTKDVLGFTRVQSTAYEPLYFANYLLIPIAIAFALFLSGRSMVKTSWLFLLFGLGIVNLILTVSRGGYLAMAFTLLIVGIFYFKKLFTLRNFIIFVIGFIVVGWVVISALGIGGELFTVEKFQEHVSNAFYGASFEERVETFDNAIVAWRDHSLVGIGFGAFGPYMAMHPSYIPEEGWKIVNNEYVEILAENGILGLFFFMLFIIFLIVRSLRAVKVAQDSYNKAIMVALLAAFIGVLVQYLTFSTLYIMHVWFLIGLMIAVQNLIFHRSRLPVPVNKINK